MKNEHHLSAHVSRRRKPCEKGAFHRELIPFAVTLSIIHGVRIALRARGVSLLPAVTWTQAKARTYLFTTSDKKDSYHAVFPWVKRVGRPKMVGHTFLSSMHLAWKEEDVLQVCDCFFIK